jgi:hypothetical protein
VTSYPPVSAQGRRGYRLHPRSRALRCSHISEIHEQVGDDKAELLQRRFTGSHEGTNKVRKDVLARAVRAPAAFELDYSLPERVRQSGQERAVSGKRRVNCCPRVILNGF